MIGYSFFVHDVSTALDQIVRADRAGVDTAWIVMSPLGYDSITLAAAALSRTERIRVGTSILPMFTRHPLTLATQVVALAGIAPGRFRLGVGTGNIGVMAHGYGAPVTRPVARTGEYLRVLRTALSVGAVRYAGDIYDVDANLVGGALAASTEVTLAALGPKLFGVAGEHADAAMSWNAPISYLDEVARPALAKGAAEAARPVPRLVVHVNAVATPDRATAQAVTRPTLRNFSANPQYAAMFAAAGFPVGDDGEPDDGLFDAVVIHGDEVALADRLAALAASGDELLVTLEPTGDSPARHRDEEEVLFRAIAAASLG